MKFMDFLELYENSGKIKTKRNTKKINENADVNAKIKEDINAITQKIHSVSQELADFANAKYKKYIDGGQYKEFTADLFKEIRPEGDVYDGWSWRGPGSTEALLAEYLHSLGIVKNDSGIAGDRAGDSARVKAWIGKNNIPLHTHGQSYFLDYYDNKIRIVVRDK